MQDESAVRDLLDRWIQGVWQEGQYDVAPGCLAAVYTRHEPSGTREVTPEAYTAEIAAVRERLPNIRFDVHDSAFTGDSAWFRFTMRWTDPSSRQPLSRAGIQIYRVEDGQLAETWVAWHEPGSMWPDALRQGRTRAQSSTVVGG